MATFPVRKLALAAMLLALLAPGVETLSAQPAVSPPTSRTLADREHDLAQLFDELWQNTLRDDPIYASALGDRRYNTLLDEVSPAQINARLTRDTQLLEQLSEIDSTGFSASEKLSLDLAARGLLLDQEGSRFKEWEMPVTQLGGFPLRLAQMADNLPFEREQDFDDYIVRLTKIPAYVQQQTDNMERGVEEGRVIPKFLAQQVLVQVQAILAPTGEASPFAAPLKKMPASITPKAQARLREQMLAAIADQVLPAYRRFARFLEVSYIPHGRADPGVWALPDGDGYYAYCVKRETTTDETPLQIHDIGLKEIARDAAEEQALFAKLGVADVHALAAKIADDPKLHPASADELLNAYRGHIAEMQAKLPSLFGKLPKNTLKVEPMPEFQARNAPAAYYEEGSLAAGRAGRVAVNTFDFAHRSYTQVEAIAYHEGVPGHHLQIALAQEDTTLPDFRKHLGYTAFVEGWALYSERLGKEIGFYRDPWSDYGRLENDMWRAVRLVVDTGVHSQHWTRQQMVDVFHQYTAMDETNIGNEVDRYIADPGQALAYKSGQMKLLELRDYAKQQLGAKFSLSAFHDEILGAGALPLDALTERVHAWVAAQQK